MRGGGQSWKYERDETPRRKHQGTKDVAEFVKQGDVTVGKCPKTLTVEQAEAALNAGYPVYNKRFNPGYPDRIYAVIDGVVYRATPTNPGVSYHGFPELPEKFAPYGELRHEILKLAEKDGSEEEVKKWLRLCRRA